MVKSRCTGEELTFEEAERRGEGEFEYLGQKQTGYYVLVPGVVKKSKPMLDGWSSEQSIIERPIEEQEKPELEEMIRKWGYKGDIVYWDRYDFLERYH